MNTLPRVTERSLDNFWRQGSDPLIQTARGRLQTRRSKLNDQINKELRMRSGAEKLFKATGNKRVRETVALELSFVNSHLQVLKEELADLNSSMEIYQNDSKALSSPMIPLGLKETKDVDFMIPFKDYILEHYSEDCELYDKPIEELNELRQAIRTPLRDESGIQLLFEYYNQLYYMERRFFPQHRSLGIYFEWYDSLTGVPNSQRTVGFEKASVLYNIGALCTQIAARQDRSSTEGLSKAIENFQKASGAFKYLHDNFSQAPSMDMRAQTLTMLMQLMLSQTQECVLEKIKQGASRDTELSNFDLAQEAATVSNMYDETHKLMSSEPVKNYVPFSWISMVQVKAHHFGALSHFHAAQALIEHIENCDFQKLQELLSELHLDNTSICLNNIANVEEKTLLGKAHLRQSILSHEEAMRIHGYCKQLRKVDTFQEILKYAHDRSLKRFAELEEEDDFTELMTVPEIKAKTRQTAVSVAPDFARHKVGDMFHRLGPLAIFSAKHEWSVPRQVVLRKGEGQEYGFSVRGDSPVIIALVEEHSIAEIAGMHSGDFLVSIGDTDVKWAKHEEAVTYIRSAGDELRLKIITPMDRNYLDPASKTSSTPKSSPSMQISPNGSVSTSSSTKSGRSKSGSWIFRKKNSSSKKKKQNSMVQGMYDRSEVTCR